MTYLGTVLNGVVILPPEARLPEGAQAGWRRASVAQRFENSSTQRGSK